jgi:hypothetical protein
LHTIAWWLLLLLCVASLFRRLLPEKTAALALLLYAVDDCHWTPLAWLANRHTLVATTLVFAGLLGHLRWRDDKWRAGLPLSLLAYTAGLTAGESALQALAFLFALELVERRPGWMTRLAPATILIVVYGALRRPLGAGIAGSGMYFDPIAQPLKFLAVLPTRLAILLGDLLGGMPCDFYFAFPRYQVALVAVGAAVVVVVAWLARRVSPPLPALLLGGLLAILPGAAGPPGSRLLLAPSFASAALVAVLLTAVTTPKWARVWLFAVHLVAAPLLLVVDQAQVVVGAETMRRSTLASDLTGDVVVVATPDMFASIYPPYVAMGLGKVNFRSWQVLSFTPEDVELSRPAADELRLEAPNLFQSSMERMIMDHPLPPGQRVIQGRLTAEVETPSALRFRFSDGVEGRTLLVWRQGALKRLSLPPIGGKVTIRREPGMMGW